MADAPTALLAELEALRGSYGGDDDAEHKRRLIERLAGRRLATAEQVHRLHEILCFLQAYPDDRALLETVENALAGFGARGDLRRHRRALADSGIAGTDTYYSFYWPTASWLAARHADQLTIDWPEFTNRGKLPGLLSILLPYSEQPAFDLLSLTPQEWLARLKAPDETDATFLIRRFAALPGDTFTREKAYEDLDVPIRLSAGPATPSRTQAKLAGFPVVHQQTPLVRKRPRLEEDVLRPPLHVRRVSRREGQRLIDAAVAAMINRARDLDAFAFGDPDDVRLVDCGDGLQFVCIGQRPERRLLLEAVYGFLTLKNGVPIGYVLTSSLFSSTEVAYNVFESFRGGEAAAIFGRVLAMARHLFGASAFSIDPYQLGHDNEEGLRSGAWWFYYKLGFRPENPDVRRLLRAELARMRANPHHRSSLATLHRLSAAHVFFYLDEPGKRGGAGRAGASRGAGRRAGDRGAGGRGAGSRRDDVLAKVALGEIGLRVSQLLADRFGADRERGIRTLSREAARLLGVRSQRGWSAAEKLAWRRWSPLVVLLPGVARWSAANRRAIAQAVRAKGGRSEADFVARFDAHRPLRRAILNLAAAE
jgi:hypothetical protein